VRGRRPRGLLDLAGRRVAAVRDVVAHGAAEQHGVLQHDRDLLAQPRERAVARVTAVDQHPPLPRVVEARDQSAERGLAGARRPRQRHALPGCDPQRDAAQRRTVVAVRERDALERDVAARAAAVMGARPLLEDLVLGEQLRDALRARHRGGDLGRLASHAAHRAVRLARVADEHEQLAGPERSLGHPQRPGDDHEGRAERPYRADEPVEARLQPRDVHARGHPLLAAGADAVGLEPLGAERLHDRHRRERLARQRRDLAVLGAPDPRLRLHAPPEDGAQDQHRRERRDRQQAEHGIDPQQDHDHPDGQQAGLGHLAQRLGEQRAHRIDVAGHAGDEVALRPAVVEAEREPLQMVVDGDPQLVRDPLAGALQPQVGGVPRDRVGERDHEHEHGDRREQPPVARPQLERRLAPGDQAVHDQRERPRLRQVGRRQHDRAGARARQRVPLAGDVRSQHARRRAHADLAAAGRVVWASSHSRSVVRRAPSRSILGVAGRNVSRASIARASRTGSSSSGSSTRRAPSRARRRARRRCSSSSGVAYGTTSAGTRARTISSAVL
jgi:hypothetical protein